jgi:hypothetical protein
MSQPIFVADDSESIESLFVQAVAKDQGCSLHPVRNEEACPSYFKFLEFASDWHAITAIFAVMLVFMFLGMAFGKKE